MKKVKEITSIPKTLEDFLKVDTGDQNPIARAAFDVLELPIPEVNSNRGQVRYFNEFLGKWQVMNVNSYCATLRNPI